MVASLSVNHLERFVYKCRYTGERLEHDYGIDLQVQTFDRRGYVENGYISFQLKATDRSFAATAAPKISITVADLNHWLKEGYPVILVLYEAKRDNAFWVHIQDYYKARAKPMGLTTTITFDRKNMITESAVREFRKRKNRIQKKIEKAVSL